MVQEFSRNKNHAQIKKLIETFSTQFCVSKDPNKRKGGLIALASCSIALGSESGTFIGELLTPVLNCLLDPDTRVRYFASESLYNIVKVSRQAIIPQFPEIFSALSKLVADPDAAVKNASELLDRLLKDIITENSQIFDLPSFVPLLRERVLTKNSFARQFLISWISVSCFLGVTNTFLMQYLFLDPQCSSSDQHAPLPARNPRRHLPNARRPNV